MSTSRVLTSELSLKTESRIMKYMLVKFGRMKTQVIMFAVFSVLSYPLAALGALGYMGTGQSNYIVMATLIGSLSVGGILILTITVATGNFEYFSRRTVVDMNYSLPITNKERFWGDFLVGIVPISVMHLLSIGAAMLTLFLGRGLYYQFQHARTAEVLEVLKGEYLQILSYVFQLAVLGFFALIGLYILTVFACVLSGRGFENWMSLVMLMGFVPGVVALCVAMPFVNVMEVNVENYLIKILSVISPVMFIVNPLYIVSVSSGTFGNFEILKNASLIQYSIFLAIILIIAYFLGTRRNVERVGNPFAHKITSDTFLAMLIFTIAALFCIIIDQNHSDNTSLVITMIIITAIAFLVFELLTKRSFKKIHIGFLKYACIMVMTLITSFSLFASHGFGIGNTIPDVNKIESVTLPYMDSYGMGSYIGADYAYYRSDYTSPEVIETIIELNKQSNERTSNSYTNRLTAMYNLKGGKRVERNVFLNNDTYDKAIELIMSDELKQERIASIWERYLPTYETSLLKSVHIMDILGQNIISLENVNLESLIAAYCKDLEAQTAEQVFADPKQPLYKLNITRTIVYDYSDYDGSAASSRYDRSNEIFVLPSFSNLIAELGKYISENETPKMNVNNKDVTMMYYGGYYSDDGLTYYSEMSGTGVTLDDAANNPRYMALISKLIPAFDGRTNERFTVIINNYELYVPNSHFDEAMAIFIELTL